MKTALVVNPASGNGRTGSRWPRLKNEIRSGLSTPFEYALTERAGHATQLTRDFILDGAEMIVSVGGDGTHNEVLNGFFDKDRPINPDSVMATITMGTGGDFVRTLGWQKSLAFALEKINEFNVVPLDVGLAEFLGLNGRRSLRYFMNVVDFGAGGAVVERVNRTTKALGGRISFLLGIMTTLITYKNKRIVYSVDHGPEQCSVLHNVIMGNGQYYGGGIKAVPMARLDDGLLDVVIMGDIGLLDAMINLPSFRKGTHMDHPKISHVQGRMVEARCDETVFIDMDGEYVGTLPARFQVLKKKLKFVV